MAVVVAGGTVVVAILGLQMAGIPFVASLGYSASLVVAVAVLVAITLLPALLSFAGPRVLSRSQRKSAEAAAEAVNSGEVVVVEETHSGWVR
jgi:RND superfamily putative drug exporter